MQLTPTIYATGRYTLKTPFTLVEDKDYTCQAIRSFAECEERGMDVYTNVYEPQGLSRADYLTDEGNNINIIALAAKGDVTVYVPDSYIAAYPNMGEAIPQRIVVSVDLGVISSHWDPQYLLTQLANAASDVVGGTPEVNLHAIPILGRSSSEDVPALNIVRDISVQNRTSDHAQKRNLEKTVTLLTDKIASLEQIILND